MEQIQAIIMACLKTQSPVILQVSAGARKYADSDLLKGMAKGAVDMMKRIAKEEGLKEIQIALHFHMPDWLIFISKRETSKRVISGLIRISK